MNPEDVTQAIKKLENEIIGLKNAADRKKKQIESLRQGENLVKNIAAIERALGMKLDKKTYSLPEVVNICMLMNAKFDILLKRHTFPWGGL